MDFELTPIWNVMLKEYGDPLVVELTPDEPTEHPIYDVLITIRPDPSTGENE